jgi:hypothetical protein
VRGDSEDRAIGASSATAATHASVNPTTHGFRRRDTSDRAPKYGAAKRTTAADALVASDHAVAEPPRSETIHTGK